MHIRARWSGVIILGGLVALLGWQASSAPVHADNPVVTARDNDAISPQEGFERAQSRWDFDPERLVVRQGEVIEFRNRRGNDHAHTFTSYVRPGPPTAATLAVGTVFDSSLGGTRLTQPGQSEFVPTAGIPQGNYGYFCRLHPWMNGEITIVVR
jgi:plastocyanin